ncbi:elongation factor G [Rhizobiales bacterium]|uniref:elongation factor G n=1 Tax=Hongsoonwoonella zoysiae TaxID=2821844 RepID=UPI00156120C2|nr:elongation factor G [Hongsoonwoonella zoysiae]NRG17703.1 elongation factor G [Hongsoonwoonella zoysiae]
MGEDGKGGQAGGRREGPRCIAIIGPFASGKTTLLEAILARTGAIHRQGTISDGNTVGDGAPEARDHSMSVEVNVAEIDYLGDTYTFLDCPGSVEFLSEADGVLAGVDMAIVVAEADEKKVPALQVLLKKLEDRGIPRVLFLNKIDKTTMRVRDALSLLQPASSVPMVLRQIPIWKDGIAIGFIDLALERAFVYREHAESLVIDMPDDDQAREVEARFEMLEKLADHDDVLMEALLEDIAPGKERVFGDLVDELRQGIICPVFIGSAEHGNGIQRLLKALRHEAPDIEITRERLGLDSGADTTLQVLKTLNTLHAGKLSIARVLTGSVGDGEVLHRHDGSEAKVSGLFRLMGQQATKRERAGVGETVGLGKLDKVQTGETLGGSAPARQLYTLEPPPPVLALAVAPKERRDEVKLSSALAKIAEEDKGLIVSHTQDTAETIIEGQGEMHLRVALERLAGKYGLEVEKRPALVPYRETIRNGTTVRGRHKKQSGGHGQFGDAVLEIRPLERGAGFVFDDRITGGVVPKQYIPAVGEGVKEALQHGPLGFPVVDVGVTLTDGSYHSVDSSDQAFRMAAILGMREGLPQCNPVLLEPIYQVSIYCPNDATAKVNAIVSSRRGQILGFDAREGWSGWDEVKATMPEAEIGELIIELRSATAGVASYTKRFDHMAELSGKTAEEICNRFGRSQAA